MFDVEAFVSDCRSAVGEGHKAVREVVVRAVSDPASLITALGEPERAGVYPLYESPDVTVINFVWAPHMTFAPHDHKMFAVIGVYNGREDNVYWRRVGDRGVPGDIEAAGAESLGIGQVATLGPDIIHSVANPLGKLTASVHVYGGDFFNPPTERSQWDHETLQREPWNIETTRAAFRDAEARYLAWQGGAR